MKADVVVAILSGRPLFRAHKRLFLSRYLCLILWLLPDSLRKGGSKRLAVFRQGNFGSRE
jgi:hypothetical protein